MTFRAAHDGTAAQLGAPRSAATRAGRRTLIAATAVAALALSGCAAQQSARSNTASITTASVGAPSDQLVKGRALAGWNGDISTPGLTAAHQSLPIGSYARVTNLGTGQSTVVQITSFLPLGRDRDIDLSRDAAAAIGALQNGVAPVTIAPLGRPGYAAAQPALSQGRPSSVVITPGDPYSPDISTASINPAVFEPSLASPARAGLTGARFLQIGSFQDVDNARRLAQRLRAQGLAGRLYGEPSIETAYVDGRLFHRVRLGPISGAELAAQALSDARTLGHADARIMTP